VAVQQFSNCHGQPHAENITMDQDPAIKQAIADVFETSIHRFYVAHYKKAPRESAPHAEWS